MKDSVQLIRSALVTGALLASLIFGSVGRAADTESWPLLPTPPRADVQWIAQSMRVNGVPTRVMQFQSRASSMEVVEYYKAHWSGGYDRQPSVHTVGEATVVGQMHGPYLMTVKVEGAPASGTSTGLISVARIVGVKVERDAGNLALMPGAEVVSVVESDDPGKRSREVVIWNSQPATSVIQFYEASLENAGWREVQSNYTPRTAEHPSGGFVVFALGGSEMQLSVTELPGQPGTVLAANLVTKDTAP
jgi:hypothetical protein